MKIESCNLVHLSGTTGEMRSATNESAPRPIESGRSDTVSLSDLSRTLAALENRVDDRTVDMARIASIKEAIRNGEFKVNPEAVADRLMQNVQELLDRNSKA